MTMDEMMAQARVEIDRLIEQRIDESFARMITAGRGIHEIEEIQRAQRIEAAEWRAETLADMPARLTAKLRETSPEAS